MILMTSLALLAAQTAPAPVPAEPAPAAAPAATALSADSPIEAIAADPKGKAVLENAVPSLLAHPMYESFKAMSLRQIQPYSSGAITDEAIAAVEAGLAAS